MTTQHSAFLFAVPHPIIGTVSGIPDRVPRGTAIWLVWRHVADMPRLCMVYLGVATSAEPNSASNRVAPVGNPRTLFCIEDSVRFKCILKFDKAFLLG
jgi:hypothetical protein